MSGNILHVEHPLSVELVLLPDALLPNLIQFPAQLVNTLRSFGPPGNRRQPLPVVPRIP